MIRQNMKPVTRLLTSLGLVIATILMFYAGGVTFTVTIDPDSSMDNQISGFAMSLGFMLIAAALIRALWAINSNTKI